jgi:hypothetical protein
MAKAILEVSNNSSSMMRSCQKKFFWHYIEGLRPIRKSNALTLGSILHSAFDMYYKGFSRLDVVKYITDTTDDEISKAGPQDVEPLLITKYTLAGMWLNYPVTMKLDEFKEIKSEMEFRVPVPGMRGVVYVGKVDGLLTDLKGRMWVRELKTTSQTFQQFETKVRQSTQGTGYIWALRKLGFPVNGMIYDYVKKPLLRKGVNEDVATFGARIMHDYSQRPDIYYKRHHSYRIDEELNLFEADLRRVAYDIRKRKQTGQFYRNPDQCWNFNVECPYLKICFREKPDPLTLQLYYEKKP